MRTRDPATPAPGGTGPELRFDGVALVGRTAQGPTIIEGLSLVLDDHGLAILGPKSGAERRIPWSGVSAASCGTPGTTPGGRQATPLDLTSSDRSVRFYLYADRVTSTAVAGLATRLAGWVGVPSWLPAPAGTTASAPSPPIAIVPPPGLPGFDPPLPPVALVPPPGLPGFDPPPAPPQPPPPLPPPLPPDPGPYATYPWTPGSPGPSTPLPAPSSYAYAPYVPFSPHGPPVAYGYGQPYLPPGAGYAATAPERKRRRRLLVLALALLLIVGGIGSALVLAARGTHTTSASSPTTRPNSPDQRLADEVMLTRNDLPSGWEVDSGAGAGGGSQADKNAEEQIDSTFVQCMGITAEQGAVALGGEAPDQTAEASSPVFVDSGSAAGSGTALELQTAAAIVRSHQDEQQDFALFTNSKFPQCNAEAAASQLQLGVNDATGGTASSGPATATVVNLTAPGGEQVFGVTMSFDVIDSANTIPVVVDQLVVGSDRIEGQLLAFAIGAQFPSDVLSLSIATFEHRLVSQGGGTTA